MIVVAISQERLDELAKSFVNEIQTKCDPDKNDDHGKVSFRTFNYYFWDFIDKIKKSI
jgi:hypothetical protein